MIWRERMLITQREFAYGPNKINRYEIIQLLAWDAQESLDTNTSDSFLRMIGTVSCLLLAITKVTRKLTTEVNATSIPRQARNVNQNTTKPSLPKLPLGLLSFGMRTIDQFFAQKQKLKIRIGIFYFELSSKST